MLKLKFLFFFGCRVSTFKLFGVSHFTRLPLCECVMLTFLLKFNNLKNRHWFFYVIYLSLQNRCKEVNLPDIFTIVQNLLKRGVPFDDKTSSSCGFWAHVCSGLGISNNKTSRYRLLKAYWRHKVCTPNSYCYYYYLDVLLLIFIVASFYCIHMAQITLNIFLLAWCGKHSADPGYGRWHQSGVTTAGMYVHVHNVPLT